MRSPGISAALAVLGIAVLLVGCGARRHEVVLAGETMGTTYSVKVARSREPLNAHSIEREIESLLATVNASMSTYEEDSELSRLNRNDSMDWIPVSAELFVVLATAREVSRLTGGAFDITVGPLVNLWGFGPNNVPIRVPADTDILRAREHTGYKLLALRDTPRAVRKTRPGVLIDLNGIAPGYAVDRVAALLARRGATDYLVEIGGEVQARGVNAGGVPWRIAIEKPVSDIRAIDRVIELAGGGLSTSGDYRNYFEQDGRRYAHEIDPDTGAPITHGLAAVTVLDLSTMRADALSTGLMILGPETGYQLAVSKGIRALFYVRRAHGFDTRATPGFDLAAGRRR